MLKLNFEKSIFIPTGWPGLDAELNGGLLSKTVTAVLAKPGMGTSAFAMNICLNAAAQGHRCLLFTHDGVDLCFAKMLASISLASIHTALRLHSDADVVSDEILTALEDLSKLDIKLRDIPSTVVELENVISEFAYVDNSGRGKSTVIVVDGLDDFDCSPTSLCNCLKKCADSCNAAVVLTAHGWRDSADVKNAMERCDAVLSIVQDEDEGATELSIHKCRYSGPFYYGGHTVQLVFLPHNAKFYELSDVYEVSLAEASSRFSRDEKVE